MKSRSRRCYKCVGVAQASSFIEKLSPLHVNGIPFCIFKGHAVSRGFSSPLQASVLGREMGTQELCVWCLALGGARTLVSCSKNLNSRTRFVPSSCMTLGKSLFLFFFAVLGIETKGAPALSYTPSPSEFILRQGLSGFPRLTGTSDPPASACRVTGITGLCLVENHFW